MTDKNRVGSSGPAPRIVVLGSEPALGRSVADRLSELVPSTVGVATPTDPADTLTQTLDATTPLVAVLAAVSLAETARRLASTGGDRVDVATAPALADPRSLAPAALARRERWQRSALTALTGLPVYVMRPAELDAEPGEELRSFLAAHGIPLAAEVPVADAGAPHGDPVAAGCSETGTDGGPPEVSRDDRSGLLLPEMHELDAQWADLAGPHDRFRPEIPTESAWSAALLDHVEALDTAFAGLEWAAAQVEPFLQAATAVHDTPWLPPGANEDGHYPPGANQDTAAYHGWLRRHGQPPTIGRTNRHHVLSARTAPPGGEGSPPFSVVVPVFRPPFWALERCVASVLAQDFPGWELVLCDDGSDDAALTAFLQRLPAVDRRITVTTRPENGGISAATNDALTRATGTFIAFLDHDDELVPHALSAMARAIAEQPDADVLYSDEDVVDHGGARVGPFLKPDWSPDLLMSYAYLCHLTVIRRQLVADVGGVRSAVDGSQDWDLALRATERARRVVHVADVLYHWRAHPDSAAWSARAKPWAFAAGQRVLEDALARRGEPGEVTQEPHFPGRFHVRRAPTAEPLVSIVVPFRDEPAMLARCVTSIRSDPGYERYELVLVDNDSQLPETAALLERVAEEDAVRVVHDPGPFNWSTINNGAVRQADGDLLLFLNNDIEARATGWLHALVGQALRPEIGAVGGRLLYPDGSLQHAGIVLGGNICWHVLKYLPPGETGYASMAIQTRDCSAVTGACLMTRRAVFDAVGGFDEALPMAYNDVDFCLKLREQGYLVVYEPLAELVHHESKSRGHTDHHAEDRRIIERWGPTIAAGDPYVNRHLSHWRQWLPVTTAEEEEQWDTFRETLAPTPSSSSST